MYINNANYKGSILDRIYSMGNAFSSVSLHTDKRANTKRSITFNGPRFNASVEQPGNERTIRERSTNVKRSTIQRKDR